MRSTIRETFSSSTARVPSCEQSSTIMISLLLIAAERTASTIFSIVAFSL